MSLIAQYKNRSVKKESPRKKVLWLSLAQALVLVAVILASARFVTVLVLQLQEEPDFSAPKTIYLPQRQLEHQMAIAEFQNAAATPSTIPTLSTESLLANVLSLPAVPNIEFTPVENDAMVSESDVLFGQSGLMGALGALSSQASSVSFLGITEEASRYVIVVDISTSVTNSVKAAGSSMREIREEAKRLIESLNANTLLGFVLHSRKFLTYNTNLVPATVANKEQLIEWLDSKFKSDGRTPSGAISGEGGTTGLVTILDEVFDMQPDVIFLVSDGNYFTNNNRSNTAKDSGLGTRGRPVELGEVIELIRDRQSDLPTEARIHSVHFPDPRDSEGRIGSRMRSIATNNGGQYRKIGD